MLTSPNEGGIHIVYGVGLSTFIYAEMYYRMNKHYPILVVEGNKIPFYFPILVNKTTALFIDNLFPGSNKLFHKSIQEDIDNFKIGKIPSYMTSSELLYFLFESIKKKGIKVFTSENIPCKFLNNPKITFIQNIIPQYYINQVSLGKFLYVYEFSSDLYLGKENIHFQGKGIRGISYRFSKLNKTIFLYMESSVIVDMENIDIINNIISGHLHRKLQKSDIKKYYNVKLEISYIRDKGANGSIYRLGNALGYITSDGGRGLLLSIVDAHFLLQNKYIFVLQYRKTLFLLLQKLYTNKYYYLIRERMIVIFFKKTLPSIEEIFIFYKNKN